MEPTKFADPLNVGEPTKKADLENRNVLFMEAGASAYLKKLFCGAGMIARPISLTHACNALSCSAFSWQVW